MSYELVITPRANRKLRKIPVNWQKRIRTKLEVLAESPHGKNNNVTALKGLEQVFRLRVGDWRVIYEVQDEQLIITVIAVNSRGSIYQ